MVRSTSYFDQNKRYQISHFHDITIFTISLLMHAYQQTHTNLILQQEIWVFFLYHSIEQVPFCSHALSLSLSLSLSLLSFPLFELSFNICCDSILCLERIQGVNFVQGTHIIQYVALNSSTRDSTERRLCFIYALLHISERKVKYLSYNG